MGFKIVQQESQERWVESEEALWLNADRSELVAEGDPAAAHLFTTPGKRISMEDAEKYGLVKPKRESKEASPAEDKQAEPAEDKQAQPAEKKPARKRSTKKAQGSSK